jgi:hypothetical protein
VRKPNVKLVAYSMQDEDENVNMTHEVKNGLNGNFDCNERNFEKE